MKIIIFGGTTEGRILAGQLAGEGHEVTVSVATDIGGEELRREGKSIRILTGRMDADGMCPVIEEFGICIDATHPYAVEVTSNIKKACRKTGTEYIRLLRDSELTDADGKAGAVPGGRKSDKTGRSYSTEEPEFQDIPESSRQTPLIRTAADAREACRMLLGTEGSILLTTGSKELSAFSEIPRDRLYVRVLPTQSSLEACVEAGIPGRNIIAMFGPFTQKLNEAVIEQCAISWLVTKESGKNGGFSEKIDAARACGVGTIIIRRPEEDGFSPEEVLRILRERTEEEL